MHFRVSGAKVPFAGLPYALVRRLRAAACRDHDAYDARVTDLVFGPSQRLSVCVQSTASMADLKDDVSPGGDAGAGALAQGIRARLRLTTNIAPSLALPTVIDLTDQLVTTFSLLALCAGRPAALRLYAANARFRVFVPRAGRW